MKGPALGLQDDIEVCFEEDGTASETPSRQLRTAAERSPSVKAAAGVAQKLQKSLEDTWVSYSEVPNHHMTGCLLHSLVVAVSSHSALWHRNEDRLKVCRSIIMRGVLFAVQRWVVPYCCSRGGFWL